MAIRHFLLGDLQRPSRLVRVVGVIEDEFAICIGAVGRLSLCLPFEFREGTF